MNPARLKDVVSDTGVCAKRYLLVIQYSYGTCPIDR